jgi:hypothetical protein
MTAEIESRVNGLDLEALGQLVKEIKNDKSKGFVRLKSPRPGKDRLEAKLVFGPTS